jgi:predicted secreted protein
MKTKYKYVEFEETPVILGGKAIWRCINITSGAQLLRLIYYVHWRRYVSSDTNQSAVFSSDCHRDIASFLDELNKEGQNEPRR